MATNVFNPDIFVVEEPKVTDTLRQLTMSNLGKVIHNYRKSGRSSSAVDMKFDSVIRKITKRVNDTRVASKLGKLDPYDVLAGIGKGDISFTTQELIGFGTQLARLQGYDNPVSPDEAKANFADLANDFVSNEDCHKFLKPEDISGEQAAGEITEQNGEITEQNGEINESQTVLKSILAGR